MSLLEFTAVEHFAHALGEPPEDVITADIAARTAAMERAVDEVIAQYSPRPGMTEERKANNFKVVDGLASMMSLRLDDMAARVDELTDSYWIDRATRAHDDTVRQYYRLIALRSDLDPECRSTGEAFDTPEDFNAWADQIFAEANAQA